MGGPELMNNEHESLNPDLRVQLQRKLLSLRAKLDAETSDLRNNDQNRKLDLYGQLVELCELKVSLGLPLLKPEQLLLTVQVFLVLMEEAGWEAFIESPEADHYPILQNYLDSTEHPAAELFRSAMTLTGTPFSISHESRLEELYSVNVALADLLEDLGSRYKASPFPEPSKVVDHVLAGVGRKKSDDRFTAVNPDDPSPG